MGWLTIHTHRLAGQFVFKAVVSGAEVVWRSSWWSGGHWVISPLWHQFWVAIVTNICSDCPPHHHHPWDAVVNAPKALTALWELHCGGPLLLVCSWMQESLWLKCTIAISPKGPLSNFTYVLNFNFVQEQCHNYLLKCKLQKYIWPLHFFQYDWLWLRMCLRRSAIIM